MRPKLCIVALVVVCSPFAAAQMPPLMGGPLPSVEVGRLDLSARSLRAPLSRGAIAELLARDVGLCEYSAAPLVLGPLVLSPASTPGAATSSLPLSAPGIVLSVVSESAADAEMPSEVSIESSPLTQQFLRTIGR
jgi:hypothetical protein